MLKVAAIIVRGRARIQTQALESLLLIVVICYDAFQLLVLFSPSYLISTLISLLHEAPTLICLIYKQNMYISLHRSECMP